MIADCDVGKIDLILTKSIFRFARNTLDALKTIRHLKENGIGIVFDQEGIHTLKEPSEFIIAVLSAYAQNESHSKSKDVRFGLEQSFRNPNSKYYQRICYGYQHNASGRLVIDEQKARTVRLIFMLSADGYSLAQITDELERQRVPSPRGNVKWSRETIRKILANEKYTGNVMLQKTYVADYLTHKQVNNNGQRCRYVVEHNHEAILRNAKPAYNNEK